LEVEFFRKPYIAEKRRIQIEKAGPGKNIPAHIAEGGFPGQNGGIGERSRIEPVVGIDPVEFPKQRD
jgi:hypothetical protein